MSIYGLIESVLGGIYGAQIGLTDEEAVSELQKSLQKDEFRVGIESELKKAFSDTSISWQSKLDECEVGYFDTEDEAREFVTEFLWDVVFKNKRN